MDQTPPPDQAVPKFILLNGIRSDRDAFEATSLMAGSLAHEFNNMLTGILGNLELLQIKVTKLGINSFEDYLTGARQSARRAAALTRCLLVMSGHQGLNPVPVDACRLIAGMELLIQETVGPDIKLKLEIQSDIRLMMCDVDALEAAILDLIGNARDAMPKGGQLTIGCSNVTAERTTLPDFPPGNYIVITIADTGTGMADGELVLAFEPFFSTKTDRTHLGLGLPMVFGFMQQMAGFVQVDTVVAKGTTIRLYFPSCKQPLALPIEGRQSEG